MRRLEHSIGPGTAYLGAMPKQQGDLDAVFARLERSQVAAVVVLNPIEEIRRKSPGYAAAIEGGDPRLPALYRVPVENFGVPDEDTKARFLEAVRAAGSNPESGAQMHFLMSIIPSLQDEA